MEIKIENNTITVVIEEDFDSITIDLKGTIKGMLRGRRYPYASISHLTIDEVDVYAIADWVAETYYPLDFLCGAYCPCAIQGNSFLKA